VKVAVGISGGVDSAVAAWLLKQSGCEVVGVTMMLGRADEDVSLAASRSVANRLGVPLKVYDLAADWKNVVCGYIRDTYLSGLTPNPCVRCNELVKFGLLPRATFADGCERFATGHYARLNEGRLFRAVDRAKDQSYFLYRVADDVRRRVDFPLGTMLKSKVREIARELGLEAADKPDSQDFCGGDPMAIVAREPQEGNVVLTDGKVIGRHQGFWNYTVGKRKGLGIGGGTPFYVVRLDAQKNEVIVGTREEAISRDFMLVDPVGRIDKSLPVKVRSAGEPRLLSEGIIGVAPGQSAVFYDNDEVVGGGIIADLPQTARNLV